MTEGEWLSATDPAAMVTFVREANSTHRTRWQGWMTAKRFWVSERKWRLLACATMRSVADLFPGKNAGSLLLLLEAWAEGDASDEEFSAAIDSFTAQAIEARDAGTPTSQHAISALNRLRPVSHVSQGQFYSLMFQDAGIARAWSRVADYKDAGARKATFATESARQADFVRCILGNPFRPPPLCFAWVAANDGAAGSIAQAIDETQSFDDLRILADALEDAGCDDDFILSHCRNDRLHARGCWVVDLVLGKQ